MVSAQVELDAAGVPAGSSVITLMCSAVGAGVLSMPYAFEHTGWAGGLALVGCIASVESFTLYVLARSAEHTGTLTYSRLVRRMLGRPASVFLSLVALAFLFGSCCAYLMVLGDSLHPLLAAVGGDAWWTQREVLIAIVGSAVILPLCFRRTLGALAGVSSLVLAGLFVVVGSVAYRSAGVVRGPGYDWGRVRAFVPGASFLQALPILVYGFQCHTNVITVFKEMEEDPKILSPLLTPLLSRAASTAATPNPSGHGGSRALEAAAAALKQATAQAADAAGAAEAGALDTAAPLGAGDTSAPLPPQRVPAGAQPEAEPAALQQPWRPLPPRALRSIKLLGMMRVVYTAVGLIAGFYSAMGLAGYLAFPQGVQPNVMLMFPSSDMLIQVARATLGLIQCISYPVAHHPARDSVYDLLLQLRGGRGVPGFRTAETLAYYGLTLAIALSVRDLGAVFKVIGGTCGGILIFGMPGALLLSHALRKQQTAALGLQLLPPGWGAHEAEGQQRRRAYGVWGSKLWWAGLALVLFAAALAAATVWSVAAGL